MESINIQTFQRENAMKRSQIRFDYEMQKNLLQTELKMKIQKLIGERDKKLLAIDREEDRKLNEWRISREESSIQKTELS